MMTEWHKHRAFASDMTTHGNWRGNCPFCGGKNTFTANIDTGVLRYNCYKLGCDVGGQFDTDMTAAEIRRHMNPEPVIKAEAQTMEIPEYMVYPTAQDEFGRLWRFMRRWGISSRDIMYDVKSERAVFPIKKDGRIIDAIGRAIGPNTYPKWYRYTGLADYFTIGEGRTLLVVEDVISSIVAWQEFPNITAMAILGTQLTAAHMEKISEYDKIVVALDPDAMSKTLEYKRVIESWTGIKAIAFKLEDDIKYRLDNDIEKLKEVL